MITTSKKEVSSSAKAQPSVADEIVAVGISPREGELVAVATSVAAGCKPCTDYHLKAAGKVGATPGEIEQAIATGLHVRAEACAIMQTHVGRNHGRDQDTHPTTARGAMTRTDALSGIGASVAVNCVSTLESYLAAAGHNGVNNDQVRAVARLATFIRGVASSHVEKLVGCEAETVGCRC